MSRVEELFRAHAGRVHRYAQRHVGASQADDIVSETFVVVLRRVDLIHRQEALWFEVVRDQWREAAVGSDEPFLAREVALSALQQCTPSEREALLLTAWDGLSPTAAAKVSGCSVNAFAVRLTRARTRFDKAVREADWAPSAQSAVCQPHREKP